MLPFKILEFHGKNFVKGTSKNTYWEKNQSKKRKEIINNTTGAQRTWVILGFVTRRSSVCAQWWYLGTGERDALARGLF